MGLSGRAVFAIIQIIFNAVILAVGVLYLRDCPVEKMIPIFLIVAGVVGILIVFLSLLQSCCYDEDMETDLNCYRLIILTIMLFWAGWFVAGNFWVYSNYQPRYNPGTKNVTDSRYCSKALYLVSFWSINLTYMFVVVLLLAAGLIFVCMPETWSQIWGY